MASWGFRSHPVWVFSGRGRGGPWFIKRVYGRSLRKEGWLNIFLVGSFRLLWNPYILSWRMKLLMFLCLKCLGRTHSSNCSMSLMVNSRPFPDHWITLEFSEFWARAISTLMISKAFWTKFATELSPAYVFILLYIRFPKSSIFLNTSPYSCTF